MAIAGFRRLQVRVQRIVSSGARISKVYRLGFRELLVQGLGTVALKIEILRINLGPFLGQEIQVLRKREFWDRFWDH